MVVVLTPPVSLSPLRKSEPQKAREWAYEAAVVGGYKVYKVPKTPPARTPKMDVGKEVQPRLPKNRPRTSITKFGWEA